MPKDSGTVSPTATRKCSSFHEKYFRVSNTCASQSTWLQLDSLELDGLSDRNWWDSSVICQRRPRTLTTRRRFRHSRKRLLCWLSGQQYPFIQRTLSWQQHFRAGTRRKRPAILFYMHNYFSGCRCRFLVRTTCAKRHMLDRKTRHSV